MPISTNPSANTTLGPSYSGVPNPNSGMQGMGGANPFGNMNLGQFNFSSPNTQNLTADPTGGGFQQILQMLTQRPESMTNNIMPGLMQILGLQGNSMMPFFQQQQSGAVAGAQSDAMRRGLTGSSIEAASMNAARQGADQNMNQFMAGQLGQLGQAYQGAVGQDVNNQNAMYQQLAQALGQQMQNITQQRAYERQLYNASQNGPKSNLMGQIAGGLGMATSLVAAPFTGGLSLAGMAPSAQTFSAASK